MTEAKYTPGPWALQGNSTVIAPNMPRIKYGKNEEYERAYLVCQPDLYTDPEWGGEEKRANARLIAAAPELLEALQEAIDCGMVPSSSCSDGGASKYSRQVQVADMIRAAVAKATGN